MNIRLARWAAVYFLGCAALLHAGDRKSSLEGETFLRSVLSSKCAQVNAAPAQDGAAVSQWDCLMRDNLKWTFENAGGDAYFIKNHDGKCLAVAGASKANGAPINQWACSNQDNEKWTLESAGDDVYYIKARHSGKCAQVGGASSQNGAVLLQSDCVNQPNVKWKLVAVDKAVATNDFVREEPGLAQPKSVGQTGPTTQPQRRSPGQSALTTQPKAAAASAAGIQASEPATRGELAAQITALEAQITELQRAVAGLTAQLPALAGKTTALDADLKAFYADYGKHTHTLRFAATARLPLFPCHGSKGYGWTCDGGTAVGGAAVYVPAVGDMDGTEPTAKGGPQDFVTGAPHK